MKGEKVDAIQLRFEKNGKYKTIGSIPADYFDFILGCADGMLGGMGFDDETWKYHREKIRKIIERVNEVKKSY